MTVTLKDVSFKGKHFEEVTVDIPQIDSMEHADAEWMIHYYVMKKLMQEV